MYQATISQHEARILIKQGAQLVDVRQPHEYARSALPGSVNIPLPDIQQALKQLAPEEGDREGRGKVDGVGHICDAQGLHHRCRLPVIQAPLQAVHTNAQWYGEITGEALAAT